MDNYDQALEQRVWSRVHGTAESDMVGALRAQALGEWTQISAFRMLSRQLPDREKAILKKIIDEDQSHAACLRGIHLLMTGTPLAVRTVPPTPEAPEAILRKGYSRKLQTAETYEALCSDSQYGHVFASLASQERTHCRILLEILGTLRK